LRLTIRDNNHPLVERWRAARLKGDNEEINELIDVFNGMIRISWNEMHNKDTSV
jgi:hypothetical protein